MFILLDGLIQKTKRTQPLHSPEPKMMSLFGSFVQPVVQTPQIIILISHNQVKQAIFYCSCMCLLILSCSPFSKDLRHRHQIIPWLQLPKPPNCNSYNSQLLKNVVYGSILADRAVSGEVASPVVIVFQTTGCCGASVFHPWFYLFALMSDKRTSERRWFISVDWTHEAHCCRFWFVWLFFKRSSHLVLGKGGEKCERVQSAIQSNRSLWSTDI